MKTQKIFLGLAVLLLALAGACTSGTDTYPAPDARLVENQAYPAPYPGAGAIAYPVPAYPGPAYPAPLAGETYPAAPGAVSLGLVPVDLAALGNLEYNLPIVAEAMPDTEGVVRLVDGKYEKQYEGGASGVVVDLRDNVQGDLNGDGVDDAAAILTVNTGGSGIFYQLAAIVASPGEPLHAATTFLGDRNIIDNFDIQDGVILLDMVVQGPDDALCCPTQQTSREYQLVGDRLLTREQAQVAPLAAQAIQALKDGDMNSLAALVHPTYGLRFSPYGYVQSEHRVFPSDQLKTLLDDPSTYTWGSYDGSGEPIALTFSDYFQRFVWSQDFSQAAQVSFDQRLGMGNTIENSHEFYPGAVVVEYHNPGQDPAFGGMDWQSLRLVFQPDATGWKLVGIIHDEWTI